MSLPGLGEPLPILEGCVYCDYNATTPVWPEVAEAMRPYLGEHFGNPSSIHVYGRACKAAVERARCQVAALIGASPNEIVFTASGTESDHTAIWSAVMGARRLWGPASGRTPHVVCSAIEHPAILSHLKLMQSLALLTFTAVPCTPEGLVSPESVAAAVTPDTVLVTVMHTNNEVGSLNPIAAITAAARAAAAQLRLGHPLLVHTDTAQSLGKTRVDVSDLEVDFLTIVGHKFGGPKGVAALYARAGVHVEPLMTGGGQERNRRAGTESVLLLVGLGAAAEVAYREANATFAHMAAMRCRLEDGLRAALPPELVRVNGPQDPARRLPNTLSVSIRGLRASALLDALKNQLAASAGAACHSATGGGASVSAVLQAMGVEPEWAVGTLRLSTGRHTTPQEIDRAVELLLREAAAQGLPVKPAGL